MTIKSLMIAFVMALSAMMGCQSVADTSNHAQGTLSSITGHANAARNYIKPDLGKPEIKAADNEMSQIPPEVNSVSVDVSTLQNDYNTLNGRWYVKTGRWIQTVLWTLVIVVVVAGLALGAINFYTGGLVGSVSYTAIFGATKLFFQYPIEYIHNSIVNFVTAVKANKTTTPTTVTTTSGS
jgi:hypothetical protein